MRIEFGVTLIILAMVLGSLPGRAEEPVQKSFMPALIGKHETSLVSLIQFPKIKKDAQIPIKCEALVDEAGRFLTNACFNGKKAYRKAVLDVSGQATVTPASVDGIPTSVYLLYTVIFIKKGEETNTVIVPNHSTNIKEMGFAYVSPQRQHEEPSTERDCPTRSMYHLVMAQVDATGSITDISLSEADERCPRCRTCVTEIASGSQFIPGFFKSTPTSMAYQEPFFQNTNKQSWYWRRNDAELRSNLPIAPKK